MYKLFNVEPPKEKLDSLSTMWYICSDGYRTNRHPKIPNGTDKYRYPNCSGNHQVHNSSCLVIAVAVQPSEWEMDNVVPGDGGPSQVTRGRAGKDKKMKKMRRVPRSYGPGYQ
jgi:hypothetical protein